MPYLVKDTQLKGTYDSSGTTINVVRYEFEVDTESDLPTQTQFLSSKNIKICMTSTAHVISNNKTFEMQSDGTWVDITPNSDSSYTLPRASSSSLGGIIVGSGLTIDSNGVLSADGGSGTSMPYTNHNGGIRGNNLGSVFTSGQQAAIADGSFADLYVGDYWLIDGIKYVIVDIDYYLNYGYPVITTDHHVIVLPDKVLSNQGYSTGSQYTTGAIYSTYLPTIALDLEQKFGHFLVDQNFVAYGSGSTPMWAHGQCILPTFTQLQGYNQSINADKEQHKASQFAYFRYNQNLIGADQNYWLRDTNGNGQTAYATPEGSMGITPNSNNNYLRPYFILAGNSQ